MALRANRQLVDIQKGSQIDRSPQEEAIRKVSALVQLSEGI